MNPMNGTYGIHPLLAYTLTPPRTDPIPSLLTNPPCPLLWDMRVDPCPDTTTTTPSTESPLRVFTTPGGKNHRPITDAELLAPATNPPVRFLTITCPLFPTYESESSSSSWDPIPVRNPLSGVVCVRDVLKSLYASLQTRFSMNEWLRLSPKQRERVQRVFLGRVWGSEYPKFVYTEGMKRVDCVLRHTLFGGLSPSPEDRDMCILTLRRDDTLFGGGTKL